MSRRIEIELTSKRPDGSWTWRAAGAKEPRGIVDGALVPAGASVNDVIRAEVETDLDGNRVLSVLPPKEKNERTGLLTILPSEKPFEPVTQQLRRKDKRDGDRRGERRPRGDRGAGRPGEKRGEGRDGERRDGERRGPREDRPRRQFTPPPPELPQRPKAKKVRPGRVNVDAVLADLPEAHRAIAEKVLSGGLPAVRAAIEAQNKENVAQGREKIPAEGLLTIAENLLPRLRVAEWRDRAAAAEKIIDEVDVRDLRQIVVASGQLVGLDEETRALVARMQQALAVRQETETRNWLEDIATATEVGRVVRALRMSSQPPKAGVPFPAALATRLATATAAGLTSDAPVERWVALLEAAAFSPVRTQVVPVSVPSPAPEALVATVTRLSPLMPQVAALFGIVADPKARPPRPLQPPRPDRKKKTGAKSGDAESESGRRDKSDKGGRKGDAPRRDSKPKTQVTGEARTDESAPEADPAPVAATESAPAPEADPAPVAAAESAPAPEADPAPVPAIDTAPSTEADSTEPTDA